MMFAYTNRKGCLQPTAALCIYINVSKFSVLDKYTYAMYIQRRDYAAGA